MDISKSFNDFDSTRTIKQEPDDVKTVISTIVFEEAQENLNPQEYYYKKELDLNWDEKDNNYDVNYKTFVDEVVEKVANTEEKKSILDCQENKSFLKIENFDAARGKASGNLDLQKYHFKEELELDWDENDNNYGLIHPIDTNKQKETKESKTVTPSKKKTSSSRKDGLNENEIFQEFQERVSDDGATRSCKEEPKNNDKSKRTSVKLRNPVGNINYNEDALMGKNQEECLSKIIGTSSNRPGQNNKLQASKQVRVRNFVGNINYNAINNNPRRSSSFASGNDAVPNIQQDSYSNVLDKIFENEAITPKKKTTSTSKNTKLNDKQIRQDLEDSDEDIIDPTSKNSSTGAKEQPKNNNRSKGTLNKLRKTPRKNLNEDALMGKHEEECLSKIKAATPNRIHKNNKSQASEQEVDGSTTKRSNKNCPKCNKCLKNLNTLKKHVYYCGKEPHLECDSCSYKAKYKNTLIVHIMRNHPQQIRQSRKKKITQKNRNEKNKVVKEEQLSDRCLRFCANCNINADKSKLNKCSKCKSQMLYKCLKCKKIYQTREKLTRHIIGTCDPKGYYHCPACDYKDSHKQTVKIHLKMHVAPGSHLDIEDITWKKVEGKDDSHWFACPSCNKQFQRKSSLGSHMRWCIKSQGVTKPPTHYVERKKDPGHMLMLMKYCAKCNKTYPVLWCMTTETSECCESAYLFKCSKCGRCYDCFRRAYIHVKSICNAQKKYKCDKCDYVGTKTRLDSHQKFKHDFCSVECPKCKQQVKNKQNLLKHLSFCGKEPLKCDHCLCETKRKDLLRAHILQYHLKSSFSRYAPPIRYEERKDPAHRYIIKKYCAKCKTSHPMSKKMSETSECCGSVTSFKCSKCGRCYDRFRSAYSHVKNVCNVQKKYKCDKCDYEATTKTKLDSHQKFKHDFCSVECPKCKQQVKNKQNLLKHLSFCGKEPLKCDHCLYATKRKHLLRAHILQYHLKSLFSRYAPPIRCEETKDPGHRYIIMKYCAKCKISHPTSKKISETSECCGSVTSFKCSKCGRCYDRFRSAYSHVKNVCNVQKKYKCDKCDYENSNPSNLKSHQKFRHDFCSVDCPNCKQRVKNEMNLRNHLSYCGKEPLKCDRCLYTTKRRHLLNTHILRKHPK